MIRFCTKSDLFSIEKICKESFYLTAFHTDPYFKLESASSAVWEMYGRPAFSFSKIPCLVFEEDGIVKGFLIYGFLSQLSEILNKKIASIILLAVLPSFQNKGIGFNLVKTICKIFSKNKVQVVTVGTDLDNFYAIRLYEKIGFRPILYWNTWRFYGCNKEESFLEKSEKEIKGPGLLLLSSFLEDSNFNEKDKEILSSFLNLKSYSKDSIVVDIDDSIVVFEKNEILSSICNLNFFRLSSLHCKEESMQKVIFESLKFLPKGSFAVEVFVKDKDKLIEETLKSLKFNLIHKAITLHLSLD